MINKGPCDNWDLGIRKAHIFFSQLLQKVKAEVCFILEILVETWIIML